MVVMFASKTVSSFSTFSANTRLTGTRTSIKFRQETRIFVASESDKQEERLVSPVVAFSTTIKKKVVAVPYLKIMQVQMDRL